MQRVEHLLQKAAGAGVLRGLHVLYNPEIRGWRIGFEVQNTMAGKLETLQVTLRDRSGRALSETWTYPLATH